MFQWTGCAAQTAGTPLAPFIESRDLDPSDVEILHCGVCLASLPKGAWAKPTGRHFHT